MAISAVHGLPGKGKSLFASYYGIYLANKYEKNLCTNFYLNPDNLAYYCRVMGYKWFLDNIGNGIVHYIDTNTDVADILSIKKSIVLLDEAGIYLPARSHSKTPASLLRDLCQIRHDSSHLIYVSQNQRQVEIALRNLTEEVFHCNGITVYSKELGNEKLLMKTVHRFTTDAYEQWLADPKIRKNPIKTKILANKTWRSYLNSSDCFLFRVYSSFGRFEEQSSYQSSSLSYDFLTQSQLDFRSKPTKYFPKIVGNSRFKYHPLLWFIRYLFKQFPASKLDFVVNLDAKIQSRLGNRKSFTRLEKLIIRFLFVILGLFSWHLIF